MKYRLILASQSPRRKELLSHLAIPFEIIPSLVDENIALVAPIEYVTQLCQLKGQSVLNSLDKKKQAEALVVAADTMVFLGKKPLGKPEDEKDAKKMLLELSGKTHQVYTGVYLGMLNPKKERSFVVTTNVTFDSIDAEILDAYVSSLEPMDKAGSYGIQGAALSFISSVEGSYSNVVGLPLSHVYIALKEFLVENGGESINLKDYFI